MVRLLRTVIFTRQATVTSCKGKKNAGDKIIVDGHSISKSGRGMYSIRIVETAILKVWGC